MQWSAYAVKPGDWGAVGGAAEGFQSVIPGGAEELVESVGEGLCVASGGGQCA